MLRITISGKDIATIAAQAQALAAQFQTTTPPIAYKEADSAPREIHAEITIPKGSSPEIEEAYPAPKKRGRPAGSKNGAKAEPEQEQVNGFVKEIEEEAPKAEVTKADVAAALRKVNTKLGFELAKNILSRYSTNLKIDEVPPVKYPHFITACEQALA